MDAAARNYRSEWDRQRSFDERPGVNYHCNHTCQSLAAEGFYLVSVAPTTLKCFACREASRGWEGMTTSIRDKHLADNPFCIRFLDEAYFLRINQPLDGTGPATGAGISLTHNLLMSRNFSQLLQRLVSNWKRLHWARQLHRLASFAHRDWKDDYWRKGPILAHHGFYYIGEHDMIQSFCCGLLLHYNDLDIDVEVEHQRLEPGCRFTPGSNEYGNIKRISPNEDIDKQLHVHDAGPGVVIGE